METIKKIGMTIRDLRKFLNIQSEARVDTLDQVDDLGLSGWDKLHSGLHADTAAIDELTVNVKVMTKTWYFELSVLMSVFLCMYTLAIDTPAVAPDDDTQVVLRTLTIFITIFLTLEMSLELLITITSWVGFKEYFTNPWHMLDAFVLVCFWVFLMYPTVLSLVETSAGGDSWLFKQMPLHCPAWISVVRAARVLRPMRTLRLLGDVSIVTECFSSSLHLFRDAILLAMFMIVLFSMVGISSYAGAFHYTCVSCAVDIGTNFTACEAADRMIFEDHSYVVLSESSQPDAWVSDEDFMDECPESLMCATQAGGTLTLANEVEVPLYENVKCVGRTGDPLGIGEDGYGTRSFDNIRRAFYTMFIHMSGDNGMQDLPNALYAVDAANQWMAWTLFAVASFILTYVALNLFLAICCTVFYDIHSAVKVAGEAKEQAKAVREKINALTEGEEEQESRFDLNPGELLNDVGDLIKNPLGDIDANRAEQDKLLQDVEDAGGWRGAIADIGGSYLFELFIMFMLVCFTVVVISQELGSELPYVQGVIVWVELAILGVFVLEFLFKGLGLGFRTYFKYGENRLDFIILIMGLVGWVGTHYMASLLETQEAALATCESSGEGCDSNAISIDGSDENMLRTIKLFRIMQMLRMTYKYRRMREVLSLVFKTASAVAYLLAFVAFVLAMFSIVHMRIMGGGCNPEYNNDVVEGCEYDAANFESFSGGCLTGFQIMTGEDWSEVMFWYMVYSPIKEWSAGYFMFMWVIVHGILYSLFISVLLLNFGMEEAEKIPAQKAAFEEKEHKKKVGGHHGIAAAIAVRHKEAQTGSTLGVGKGKYDLVGKLKEQALVVLPAERGSEHKSLYIFYLDNPIRIFAAKVESHDYFELFIITLVLINCAGIALEGPSCNSGGSLDINSLSNDLIISALTESGAELANVTETGANITSDCIAADCFASSGDCIAELYMTEFDILAGVILGAFYLELILRSISRGFILKSGNVTPFLGHGYNQVDICIIIICTFSHVVNKDSLGVWGHAIRLLGSMAPAATLVRSRALRKILTSFGSSLPMVGVVSVPIVFLMMMLSLVGVELFGRGQFQRCMLASDHLSFLDDDLDLNQTECEAIDGLEWVNPPWNFDNALSGTASLLKASSAGVMNMQLMARDIAGEGLPPTDGAFESSSYFFVAFHLIFTFFLLNLFIGVMSRSFSEKTGSLLITALQRRWIQCNENLLGNFVPQDDENEEFRPMPGAFAFQQRRIVFEIVSSPWFHHASTLVIVLNCAMLITDHYPQDPTWAMWVSWIDVGFLVFYCIEMVIKMFGLSPVNYFKDGWNSFDFILVGISLVSMLYGTDSGLSGLRVLRSFRLFLLMNELPGLTGLIDTVIHCLEPAISVCIIGAMDFYIFAIAGMRMFGDAGTNHSFYDDNNNFKDFGSSLKLLFQVMAGQNYMWLTQDLVAEGKDEKLLFLFFITFFILNVLILINLFTIIVLETFDAKAPVAQTITPVDLWAFTHAWAEQTIGAGACPSLQSGHASNILRDLQRMSRIEHGEDAVDDAGALSDSGEDDDDDWGATTPRSPRTPRSPGNRSPRSPGGKELSGMALLQYRHARNHKRPSGVVEITLNNAEDLTVFDGDAVYTTTAEAKKKRVRPYIRSYTKPNGRSHPYHTKHYEAKKNIDLDEAFYELFLDKTARKVTLELLGDSDEKLGQAQITVTEIAKCVSEIGDAEEMRLPLSGALKNISEATEEELANLKKQLDEKKEEREGSGSPRYTPTPTASNDLPEQFRPIIGYIECQVLFKPGLALPKFDFMNEFADNRKYKERGCGIEGWLWKRSSDTFGSWERRWTWIEMDPGRSIYDKPSLCYYNDIDTEQELQREGRKDRLSVHHIDFDQIVNVEEKLIWKDGRDHTAVGEREEQLATCEFQFTRLAHKSSDGKHDRSKSPYRFRSMAPTQKMGWVTALRWLADGCKTETPDPLAHPPLNARDIERVKNNPALCPMPFHRTRQLLSDDMLRASALGMHLTSTRERLLYTLFNLESHGMQHSSTNDVRGEALKSHIGEYLSEIRGLDYMMTLRRLCLLHYGKVNSLLYPMQVEEYRHDLHRVALQMISTAVSAWVFGKMLPEYYARIERGEVKVFKNDTRAKDAKKSSKKAKVRVFPASKVWQSRPSTYRQAVVGVAVTRLHSLSALWRGVKTQQPPLMAMDERNARAEKIRRAAMTEEERLLEDNELASAAQAEKNEKARIAAEKEKYSVSGWCGRRRKADSDEQSGEAPNDSTKQKFTNPLDDEDDYGSADEGPLTTMELEREAMANDDDFAVTNEDTELNEQQEMEDKERKHAELEATYESVWAEFVLLSKAQEENYLDKNAAAKLVGKWYSEVIGMKAKKFVDKKWSTLCGDSSKGLSYTDWRIWDADCGGLIRVQHHNDSGAKKAPLEAAAAVAYFGKTVDEDGVTFTGANPPASDTLETNELGALDLAAAVDLEEKKQGIATAPVSGEASDEEPPVEEENADVEKAEKQMLDSDLE